MFTWVLLPFLLQGVAMTVDEFFFHRRRGLPRWERIGHPLDTLTLLACALWVSAVAYSPARLPFFAALAGFSCLFVTKDEWVHKRECPAGEQWLHALLFILHPCVLISWGFGWAATRESEGAQLSGVLHIEAASIFLFLVYQITYWNFSRRDPVQKDRPAKSINTKIYSSLGERWYTAQDDPVALLRAESRLRNPWVLSEVRSRLGKGNHRVLDIGCGAGFLSNFLAENALDVTGVDQSVESLAVARAQGSSGHVHYLEGAIEGAEFSAGSFDVCCAMDLLEHVEDVPAVIALVSRYLRPGGLFFFHTFNRNPLSWLVAIKGVEWFVKNTPPQLHLYRLFIRPRELRAICESKGLRVVDSRGVNPRIFSRAFWRMLRTGEVPMDFEFRFGGGQLVGYSGIAYKT